MWRKISLLVVLLSISLVILLWPESEAVQTDTVTSSKDPLITLFRESEAKFAKLQIEGWVLINNNFETLENLNQVIDTIDAETDVSLARLKRTTFGEEEPSTDEVFSRGIHLEGQDQGYNIIVDAQSTRAMHDDGPQPETYIIITLESDNLALGYKETYEQIRQGLKRLAPNSQASVVITAKANSKFSEEQIENKFKTMLEAVEGKKINSIIADNLISLTGYTPQINNYVKVSNQKININIASRYNYLEEKTYFYIGNPIISTEY